MLRQEPLGATLGLNTVCSYTNTLLEQCPHLTLEEIRPKVDMRRLAGKKRRKNRPGREEARPYQPEKSKPSISHSAYH